MYPHLEAVRVEYEERGVFKDLVLEAKGPRNEAFSVREFGPSVKCSNPNCDGGYLFQVVVDSMIADGEAKREGPMWCRGTECVVGQERRPCINSISYMVKLVPRRWRPTTTMPTT
jgi:hypothetical protein